MQLCSQLSKEAEDYEKYVVPKIAIREVTKTYLGKEQNFVAMQSVSLSIYPNEFISIVGPSGCGKSTLLRMVAGLDETTEGKIFLDGKEVFSPGAERGVVFQGYTLFPWLTVAENIAFGLDLKGMLPKERQQIVDRYLELIKLTEFAQRYPKELSGGMKQRVAIARALANNPSVLLMDEPFGALDPQTKISMQEMLVDIWQKEKTTIIFITHDIEEAIFLAQRVYVMQKAPGRIVKVFSVPLPEERTSDLKDGEEFIRLRKQIVTLLKH